MLWNYNQHVKLRSSPADFLPDVKKFRPNFNLHIYLILKQQQQTNKQAPLTVAILLRQLYLNLS